MISPVQTSLAARAILRVRSLRKFRRELEGVGEEGVAQQHGERVSPAGAGGRRAPAQFGAVHDVVVHEGGDVDQFEHHAEAQVDVLDAAGGAGGEGDEGGSDAFAAGAGDVADVALDGGVEGAGLVEDGRLDFFDVRADQLEREIFFFEAGQHGGGGGKWRGLRGPAARSGVSGYTPRMMMAAPRKMMAARVRVENARGGASLAGSFQYIDRITLK